MTFCRRCWTSYTEQTLPADCPHVGEPHVVTGGTYRSISSLPTCGCPVCGDDDDDDEV